jgi:hypothetical protein
VLYRTDATGLATAPPRVVDCHSLLHLRAPKAVRACDAADACDELVILTALKVLLRRYGLKCLSIEVEPANLEEAKDG